MKIGVIIIFRNNEFSISTKAIIKQIKATKTIKFCFVDNYSKDLTLRLLYEIKEDCEEEVEVVEIKKVASESMAKRAGVRYLINAYDLKYIGFLSLESLQENSQNLNAVLEYLVKDERFINQIKDTLQKNREVKNQLKSVFSIIDSIKDKTEIYQSLRLSV